MPIPPDTFGHKRLPDRRRVARSYSESDELKPRIAICLAPGWIN